MIISRSREFIFMRPGKVASSSVQQALGLLCNEQDSVSEVWLIGAQPKQFKGADIRCVNDRPSPGSAGRRYEVNVPPQTDIHMLPKAIRELDPLAWERSTKVTIARNPWDLMVSLVHQWLISSFSERQRSSHIKKWMSDNFAKTAIQFCDPWHEIHHIVAKYYRQWDHPKRIPPGWGNERYYLTTSGTLLPDLVLRFESIAADVEKHFGAKLPHLRRHEYRDRAYRNYYTCDAQRAVAKRFATEIELFGYTF